MCSWRACSSVIHSLSASLSVSVLQKLVFPLVLCSSKLIVTIISRKATDAEYGILWYPRHKLQNRVGLFFGVATLAGTFSGFLAFEFMAGTRGLQAWSWICVHSLETNLTSPINECRFIRPQALVEFPSIASSLTPEERAYII